MQSTTITLVCVCMFIPTKRLTALAYTNLAYTVCKCAVLFLYSIKYSTVLHSCTVASEVYTTHSQSVHLHTQQQPQTVQKRTRTYTVYYKYTRIDRRDCCILSGGGYHAHVDHVCSRGSNYTPYTHATAFLYCGNENIRRGTRTYVRV